MSNENLSLGFYADGDIMYVIELAREDNALKVKNFIEKQFFDEGYDAPRAVQLIERVCAECHVNKMTMGNVGTAYSQDEIFSYEKVFPRMKEDELREAVFWDIDVNCPFGEERYLKTFESRGDVVWAAAIDNERGMRLIDAAKREGLRLNVMTVIPLHFQYESSGGVIRMNDREIALVNNDDADKWGRGAFFALYAAMAAIHDGDEFACVNFLPRKSKSGGLACNEVVKEAFIYFLILLFSVFSVNTVRMIKAEREVAKLKNQMTMLDGERAMLASLEDKRRYVEATDKILVSLSSDRRSWYYIFYVLGITTMDNVRLTELEPMGDGDVRCRGKAKSYAALVDFVQMLDENKKMFSSAPVLEKFEASGGNAEDMNFSIRLFF
ncbi:MAG: hypothetical protein IJT82_06320 [Schwartzia sp.]|nr:hypothetical protein [Schwartzia sp. (in: firmicutes)]